MDNVLASQHVGSNIAPVFPVHASVGITTASNIAPTPKKGPTHRTIQYHNIAEVKAFKRSKEGSGRDSTYCK